MSTTDTVVPTRFVTTIGSEISQPIVVTDSGGLIKSHLIGEGKENLTKKGRETKQRQAEQKLEEIAGLIRSLRLCLGFIWHITDLSPVHRALQR